MTVFIIGFYVIKIWEFKRWPTNSNRRQRTKWIQPWTASRYKFHTMFWPQDGFRSPFAHWSASSSPSSTSCGTDRSGAAKVLTWRPSWRLRRSFSHWFRPSLFRSTFSSFRSWRTPTERTNLGPPNPTFDPTCSGLWCKPTTHSTESFSSLLSWFCPSLSSITLLEGAKAMMAKLSLPEKSFAAQSSLPWRPWWRSRCLSYLESSSRLTGFLLRTKRNGRKSISLSKNSIRRTEITWYDTCYSKW